jgi:hypothetical protein
MLAAAAVVSLAALGSASCSDDDNGPTPLPTTFIFTSTLLPSNEVPPVTNADATGSGTLTMTLLVNRDSGGGITGGTATFAVTMTGFAAGRVLTGAHIHNNVAGQTAGVFLDSGLANGEVTLTNGTGAYTKTVNVTAAQAEAIIANPAGFYYNVHTTINTGGAIRGQLSLQSSTPAIRY